MATISDNTRNQLNAVGFERVVNRPSYRTHWCDKTGKQCQKNFSVKIYGEALAYLLAYNLREEMVAKYYNRP